MNCPYCGGRFELTKVQQQTPHRIAGQAGNWTPLLPFADAAPSQPWMREAAAAPTFSEAKRTSPARAATVESDVKVPFLQAAISGSVVGLASVPFVVGLHWPWYVPFPVAIGVFGLAWVLLLVDHRSLLRVAETIINRDLDRDGQVGRPIVHKVKVELHEEHSHGERLQLADIPAPSPTYLQAFARDILSEMTSFSERGAAGYGYSREMWNDLRNLFTGNGWARWRNPQVETLGVELTRKGRAVLRGIAETALTGT